MASVTFFVFLTLALSFTTIHARESQFFAKVSNNIPQESQPLNTVQNTNEKDLKFVPQTRENTEGSGYGLFGHESGQLPPSATTTNSKNENNFNNNNNYLPSNLPENYNPVAYTTPSHSSTQDDTPNEFSYEPQQAYKGDNNNNNNMYNSQNQEEFMQTNDDEKKFNFDNQDEFMQTNDANMYNPNNPEKQGMSDTKFLNNGKYYYAGDNSQTQDFGGAKFAETQESGNDNLFNNQKQDVNSYNNQEMYNSENQVFGGAKFVDTQDNLFHNQKQDVNSYNNQEMYKAENQGFGGARFVDTQENLFNNQKQDVNGYNNQEMYNSENNQGENTFATTNNGGRQGMSDTRFLENGKYYYDLNLENQKYSRGVRNGHETYESYDNNENSYDRYNTNNANGGYQDQGFQVNQDDQFNP